MKLQLVPAARGALWVRQGFGVFFQRPLVFAGLLGMFSLAVLVAGLVPLIGAVVGFGAMPLMSLGFMIATEQSLHGTQPRPSVFWLPLKGDADRKRRLLQMCLGYALCLITMLSIWMWLDDGQLDAYRAAMTSGNTSPEAMNAMVDGGLLFALFTPLLFISVLSVPFWHAPALVHWGGLPAGKALFFSVMACWRNKAAFAVYSLVWAGVLMGLSVVTTLLAALLGGPQVVVLAIMPVALFLSTAFYTSLYFTFVDCFETTSAPPAIPEEPMP